MKKLSYKRKLILVLCVLICILLTGLIISNRTNNYIITLTDSGFSPSEIKIKEGDSITFKSETGEEFWPASDFHPSHDLYPEFDPRRAIYSGEEWVFKFDKPGTWRFHDHLNPFYDGKITVGKASFMFASGKPKAEKSLSDCVKSDNRDVCLIETAKEVLKEKGVSDTLRQVAVMAASDRASANSCHQILHLVGQTAYDVYAENSTFAASPDITICSYGFYHGFMEGMLNKTGSFKEARSFCRLMKEKMPEIDISSECFHGIGHGVTEDHELTRIDDVRAFIKKSLGVCEEVSSDYNEQHQCGTGVFNGLANLYLEDKFGLKIDESNPLWVCKGEKEVFISACYALMSRLFLKASINDIGNAIELAKNTIDEKYKSTVVTNIMVVTINNDSSENYVRSLKNECLEYAQDFERSCVVGLVSALLQNGDPSLEYIRALSFCSDEAMSERVRDECFGMIYFYLPKMYTQDKIGMICGNLQERRDVCEKTALN